MFVNAKQFCAETKFPVRTLNRYIRGGLIPCHRVGRTYILDKQKTLECLEVISTQATVVINNKRHRRRRKTCDMTFSEMVASLRKG